MSFESLANELFLDLFDYFDGSDLLYAFSGLNFRFNDLLYKQYRTYRFNFKSISKYKFDIICQQHLPFINDQIITLSLSNSDDTPQQIDLFFSYIPSFQQFTQLRSLSVYKLYTYEAIMKVIDQCHQLYHLTHFKFDHSYLSIDRTEYQSIIDNIWTLPKLIRCEIDVINNIFEADYRTPIKTSSSLQSLSMSGEQIKLNQINQLFKCTPCLKNLSIGIADSDNDYFLCLLPTLTKLKIFVMIISDISKIICLLQNMPNLYHLNIDLFNNIIAGYQWEKLISNYLSKLKIFHLEMQDYVRSNETPEKRTNELINPFRSSFWIDKHRWFIRCFAFEKTVYLYSSSSKPPTQSKNFPDLFLSTDPNDDIQNFSNDIVTIRQNTFFDHPIPSNIRLNNIKNLEIKFPINSQFWTSVPNLNQLYSLKVYVKSNTSQSQLQALLDRAPHLYKLIISCDELSSWKRPNAELLRCTNASVRHLDVQQFVFSLNDKDCMTLIHSSLVTQCEMLSIPISSGKNIVNLIYSMNNLRVLDILCGDDPSSYYSLYRTNDHEFDIKNILNNNELMGWLKERLPSTCSIGTVSDYRTTIQIWIKL